jgi:hypothetical protein
MLHLRAVSERERTLDVDAQVAIFAWPSTICTARRLPVCL